MPSIGGVIELLGALESEKLSVHEERCVAVRNRHADCLRCAEVCTSGAIRYANNRLTVDPSRCIGCGTYLCHRDQDAIGRRARRSGEARARRE